MTSGSNSIVKNALFGFSTWILPLFLSFAATPIIVSALGNESYGVYALVLGFVGYSFNFSIGRAITKYIAEYRAEGNPEKATGIISATLTLNLLVGIAGAVLILALTGWLVDSVFLIKGTSREVTVYAFYFAALIIFMTMMSQVGNAILQGVQRFDVYSRLFNANSVGIIGGNIILAWSGFGLIWLLAWNLAALSITSLVGIVLAHRIVPEFQLRFDFSRKAISKILGYSTWVIAYQVLANVLLLFERGWIMRKLGPEELTYYVVPMTIGMLIHSSIASLMLVLFPLASELANDRPKLLRLYQKATKVTCMLVFFVVISLIVQSKMFMGLWMGPVFAEASGHLLVIHTISFGLLAILIVAWQMADGLGHPGYNLFVYTFCLIISTMGMIYLIDDYGNTGMALSRLAGFGVIMLSVLYSEKWFFGKVQFGFWVRVLTPLAVAGIVAASLEYLIVSRFADSWFILIGTTLAGGLCYTGVLLVFGFISEDEKILLRRAIHA